MCGFVHALVNYFLFMCLWAALIVFSRLTNRKGIMIKIHCTQVQINKVFKEYLKLKVTRKKL